LLKEDEMKILGIISKRLLVRKEELVRMLKQEGFSDGLFLANRLKEMGYLKFVDAVGSPCYTITQSGMKILKGE